MTTMMLLESIHDSSQIVHRAVGGLSLYNTGATSLAIGALCIKLKWRSGSRMGSKARGGSG